MEDASARRGGGGGEHWVTVKYMGGKWGGLYCWVGLRPSPTSPNQGLAISNTKNIPLFA